MKPIQTEGTNARLILPHEEGLPDEKRTGDVPVERCVFDTKETGEQRPGFESTWRFDDGERRAIANGADLVLRLWGAQHPPVNMAVGEPDPESMQALVTVEQCGRAATRFFELLSLRFERDGEVEPKEIPKMFDRALKETVRPDRRRNGNGSS